MKVYVVVGRADGLASRHWLVAARRTRAEAAEVAEQADAEAKTLNAWECPVCGPSKRGDRTPWIMHSN